MAKPAPQPDQYYGLEEVQEMCVFSSAEQLWEWVADGRFLLPIQHTRESKPLWSGELLFHWLKVAPFLRRRQDAPAKGRKNSEEN